MKANDVIIVGQEPIDTRITRLKALREEALKHPEENKLYIEDLSLDIRRCERKLS